MVVGGNHDNLLDQYQPYSSTWTFAPDERKWSDRSIVVAPKYRSFHSISSLGNGKAVMFGGTVTGLVPLLPEDSDETFIWISAVGGNGHGGWYVRPSHFKLYFIFTKIISLFTPPDTQTFNSGHHWQNEIRNHYPLQSVLNIQRRVYALALSCFLVVNLLKKTVVATLDVMA
jgi:hypothetical protein